MLKTKKLMKKAELNVYQKDTIIGMQEVAEYLLRAAETQQRVVVYGDYDADGFV